MKQKEKQNPDNEAGVKQEGTQGVTPDKAIAPTSANIPVNAQGPSEVSAAPDKSNDVSVQGS